MQTNVFEHGMDALNEARKGFLHALALDAEAGDYEHDGTGSI